MNITHQSKLTLFELEVRPDRKHYIVEDKLSGEFYEMPKVCIDAIELMNKGKSLKEIETFLLAHYPPDEVDIIPFAEQLVEFGLVKEIDGEQITIQKKANSTKGFEWISPKLARFFFNKITNKLYIGLFLLNIGLFVWKSELLPHYQDLFIFDSMMLNIITYMGISLFLLLLHELGHILAIRSYRLPTKMDVGNRLIFIVLETDLSATWKLAPKQRSPIYFAGMSFEQVIIFISIMLLLVIPDADSILSGILGIIIFDIVIKTIYQFCFYMKTDMYYIVENMTGYYNLMENGKHYLRRWLPFLKVDQTTEAYENEEGFTRVYSVFYLLGIVLTMVIIGIYVIPVGIHAYSQVFSNLSASPGDLLFWDSIAVLGQTIIIIGLLLYVKWKQKKN